MSHPPRQLGSVLEPGDDTTRKLSTFLGIPVKTREFTLPGGIRIAVDHADTGEPPRFIAQSSALGDRLRSTHRNKAIADAFKLSWLRDHHLPETQVALVVGAPFARTLVSGTWLAEALSASRVRILVNGDTFHAHPIEA